MVQEILLLHRIAEAIVRVSEVYKEPKLSLLCVENARSSGLIPPSYRDLANNFGFIFLIQASILILGRR